VGGKYYIFPGIFVGSSFTWDQNILTGPIDWNPHRSSRELFNAVSRTYVASNYPYNTLDGQGDSLYDNNGFGLLLDRRTITVEERQDKVNEGGFDHRGPSVWPIPAKVLSTTLRVCSSSTSAMYLKVTSRELCLRRRISVLAGSPFLW
jgi:hypothetical protein